MVIARNRGAEQRYSHLQPGTIGLAFSSPDTPHLFRNRWENKCVCGGNLSENKISTQMPADGLITCVRVRAPAWSSKCAEMVFKQDSTLLNPSRLN